MYEYLAEITDVVDGDTVKIKIDLGFGIVYGQTEPLIIRLIGLNAPEMKTPAGPIAKQFVIDWLNEHALIDGVWQVIVRTYKDKKEKYGRYLAEIDDTSSYANSLNKALLDSGNAVKYPIDLVAHLYIKEDQTYDPVDVRGRHGPQS